MMFQRSHVPAKDVDEPLAASKVYAPAAKHVSMLAASWGAHREASGAARTQFNNRAQSFKEADLT